MTEAKFQTQFTRWAKHYFKRHTAAFELKLVKETSMPFSAIRPHQWECLSNVKKSNLVHKIADVGIAPKPFDCFVLAKAEAYFAIMFYKRGVKTFYLIDIDQMIKFRDTCNKKSITEREAHAICTQVGWLA